MFRKIILFLIFFNIVFFKSLYGNQKDLLKKNIINQIKSLDSLEFTFFQQINEKQENGDCLLKFPGKLKCNYYDDKFKELVINKKKLAITQKRYNKTYFYPVSKSQFLNILYKENLIEIINKSKINILNNTIELTYEEKGELIVIFEKNSLNLIGWRIVDQYNNKVSLSINIIAKNADFTNDTFELPKLN